ncbi:tRNA pseudouridine(38-40) synthase TruA [Kamptonema cortianum]|nr:tRNA pseudouridine(38-40) synthase TruA [Kamptonema cortianum]
MRTYKITLSYDGRSYAGWQTQSNGVTVQKTLENALSKIFCEEILIEGSGRTDAGVHALGQVASFRQMNDRPVLAMDKLLIALNTILPPDIRIHRARVMPESFHARYNAKGKEYHYHVFNTPFMPALWAGRAWWLWSPLNLRAMREAAKYLVGEHDFTSFTVSTRYERGSMVRHLHRITISAADVPDGDSTRFGAGPGGKLLTFKYKGGGFLFRMVRCLTGTLVAVGQGKLQPQDVRRILKARDRRLAAVTAPPDGLYLVRVFY